MHGFTGIGMALAIAAVIVLAFVTRSGKKQSSGLKTPVVVGLLLGTIIGGSSTIGTAQLAYHFGMSAWWFTLGGGIALVILALQYVTPLRHSGSSTLVGILGNAYGQRAGISATVLNATGTFINVFAQLLAASAVVQVVWPLWGDAAAIALAGCVMLAYVVFGGTRGAGIVGLLKLVLISLCMVGCGLLAWTLLGGGSGVLEAASKASQTTGRDFLSLFCRGFGIDIGACLSLILGVITTQTYAQALIAAASDRIAKASALISAPVISLIGIFGILVGLYMRTVTDPALFNSKTALTSFILHYAGLPDIVAGIFLGTLFIATIGTGAGLALGIASMLKHNLLSKTDLAHNLGDVALERTLIALIIASAGLLVLTPAGDVILYFSVLSMGLRGCTVFAPLAFALWAPGRIPSTCAFWSIVLGTLSALVLGLLHLFGLLKLPCDAVFPGIIVSAAILLLGLSRQKDIHHANASDH